MPENRPREVLNVAGKVFKTLPRDQRSLSARRQKQITGAISNLQQSGNS
jgi:hypothetical protein